MTIQNFLNRFQDTLNTKEIIIGQDVIISSIPSLKKHLGDGPWLVCTDENTWKVAGKTLCDAMESDKIDFSRVDVPFFPLHEKFPMCDEKRIEWFEKCIETSGAKAAIAVGSGSINDVVKLASFKQKIPMACIATAPSMNGFTSGIAAVLSNGVKTTQPCLAPVVVVADLDVLANAPQRMIQSGLGDLLSKPVSNSDWLLSARLNGTFHSAEAMEIIEAGSAMLDDVAEGLPKCDIDATRGLTGSLMLSGLAMSVAGSSSPASGGEHLISHYIDMTAHAFGQSYDFHGCQVGVGTLVTAHFYEKLWALDPADIDIDKCVEAVADWDTRSEQLKERFGKLFSAVEKHANPAHPTDEILRARLEKLVANWDTIKADVNTTLRTRKSIEDELLRANCPVKFSDIGIKRQRSLEAITFSKDIRNRYTILHLAWELGHLESWAEEALELIFD